MAKPTKNFSIGGAFSNLMYALPHLMNDAASIARETEGVLEVMQFKTYIVIEFSPLYKQADVLEDLQIALSQGLDVPEAFKESESDA